MTTGDTGDTNDKAETGAMNDRRYRSRERQEILTGDRSHKRSTDTGDWSRERQQILETGWWCHTRQILEEPQANNRYWRLEPQTTTDTTGAMNYRYWSHKRLTDTGAMSDSLEPQTTDTGDWSHGSDDHNESYCWCLEPQATANGGATNDRYWSHATGDTGATGGRDDR